LSFLHSLESSSGTYITITFITWCKSNSRP